ncbi:lysosomal acid glucosylceramidase-like [Bradysia coprophila]|uniref:lysosomal acid glucosylceramidase-like n=1 Tax=Bradysia coprophila TaxID=38358 RepID=UPI00187D8371|nr:lysosomal acid glucosylceramidase-like [Bradysia coprophila]
MSFLTTVCFLIGLLAWIPSISAEDVPCAFRAGVCVCNETYCDQFDFVRPNEEREFKVVTSSAAGKRYESQAGEMDTLPTVPIFPFLPITDATLSIDRTSQFQEMIGFGGAVTGSVRYLYNATTDPIRRKLLDSVFTSGGLAYTLIRTSIGGCDFDLKKYAFFEDHQPDSLDLPSINESDPNWDQASGLVYMLNRIFEVKPQSELKLFAAVWSPPVWMKTCEDWSGWFCTLKPEFNQTYADYHLRFLEFMKANGIDVYAISTGNEPTNGIVGLTDIMSLGWWPSDQGKWVSKNLGPTLKNSPFSNVKILTGDDQRWEMPLSFGLMELGAADVMNYIDMFGVHWYWDDYIPAFLNDVAHIAYPTKLILNTESCSGSGLGDPRRGPVSGSWDRCEDYVSKYIKSFLHWNTGWIDWNLWLNEQGGPVNIDNAVDASIIVNETTGNEFYKQPMYFGIGHFSKFISTGCKRIASYLSTVSLGIEAVAFECSDNTVTVILHNRELFAKTIRLVDTQMEARIELSLDAKSVTSVVYVYN